MASNQTAATGTNTTGANATSANASSGVFSQLTSAVNSITTALSGNKKNNSKNTTVKPEFDPTPLKRNNSGGPPTPGAGAGAAAISVNNPVSVTGGRRNRMYRKSRTNRNRKNRTNKKNRTNRNRSNRNRKNRSNRNRNRR